MTLEGFSAISGAHVCKVTFKHFPNPSEVIPTVSEPWGNFVGPNIALNSQLASYPKVDVNWLKAQSETLATFKTNISQPASLSTFDCKIL